MAFSAAVLFALGAGLRCQSSVEIRPSTIPASSNFFRQEVQGLQSTTGLQSFRPSRAESGIRANLSQASSKQSSLSDVDLSDLFRPASGGSSGSLLPPGRTTPLAEVSAADDLRITWGIIAFAVTDPLIDLSRPPLPVTTVDSLRAESVVRLSEQFSSHPSDEVIPSHRRLFCRLNRGSFERAQFSYLSRAFPESLSSVRTVAARGENSTLDEPTDRLMAQSLKESRWLRTRP